MTWAQAYPTVYRSLAAEYPPAEQVDRLLAGVLGPGTGLEYAESFLDDVGRALKQVGKVVVQALPGAVSGAIGGAPAGLPGIIGGALLGGAGSLLSRGSTPATPATASTGSTSAVPAVPAVPVAALPAGPAATPSPTTPTPATPASAAAAAPAAAAGAGPETALVQLLTALSSPTVRDAISAMLLGGAGARTVPTATGAEVPTAAVTNLLGTLSTRASAEWDAIAPHRGADHLAVAGYAETVDTANPEARAAWLYRQLAPPEDEADSDPDWQDDAYDDLEALLREPAAPEDALDADDSDDSHDGDDLAETAQPWRWQR